MKNYINSVTRPQIHDDWNNLKRNREVAHSDKLIEAWLHARNPLTITYYNIRLVQEAVAYVIKKILYLTGITFQAVVVAGVSNFLDLLAYTFELAAKTSVEVAGFVANLMRRILSAIGIIVETVKDLTASFIRWTLIKFTEAIYQLVRVALHLANSRT